MTDPWETVDVPTRATSIMAGVAAIIVNDTAASLQKRGFAIFAPRQPRSTVSASTAHAMRRADLRLPLFSRPSVVAVSFVGHLTIFSSELPPSWFASIAFLLATVLVLHLQAH